MASSLAIGIYASSFVALTFSASIFFLLAALLFLISFWQIRKGLAGLVALCSFFFLFGLVRAQMPDVKWIPDTLYSYALGLSDRFQHLISSTGLSTETESLISALLLGHRTGLSADTVELFRQTGASHILALSGLHLSILTGVIYYCLLRVLVTPLRYNRIIVFVGLCFGNWIPCLALSCIIDDVITYNWSYEDGWERYCSYTCFLSSVVASLYP